MSMAPAARDNTIPSQMVRAQAVRGNTIPSPPAGKGKGRSNIVPSPPAGEGQGEGDYCSCHDLPSLQFPCIEVTGKYN